MKNIPKLRFPEFRDAAEWETKPLKNRAENLDNLRVPITESERSKGDIPYYGASGIIDYVEDYIFNEDLLCVSEDGANLVMRNYPIAFSIAGKTWVNNHAHVLRFKEKFTQIIIENYLNSMKLDDYLTGMAQPKLNKAMLDSIPIPLPFEPKEQQKIADCLSSIDELITSQAAKVEALKEHKKALMQRLFPREGETVPRLRFPEFQNAPEWEEKVIGDIGRVSMCKRVMKDETIETGDIPFYKIGTFGKKADAYISKALYEDYITKYPYPKKGDILISASGTIGRLVVFDGLPAYFQDSNIVWIDNDEKIVKNSFLLFFYTTVKWTTEDTTIARLYNDNLRNVRILVPSIEEQQKIADCLSSIDELITSEAAKEGALKEHKKALMQQLFPTDKER